MEVGVPVFSKEPMVKTDVSNKIIASCHHSNKNLVCVAFGWLATSGKNAPPLYFKLSPIGNKYT